MCDAREIFLTPDQPHVAQLRPRQARLEIFLVVEGEIELCFPNRSLVITGVGKYSRAASWHLPAPVGPGEPTCDPRSPD